MPAPGFTSGGRRMPSRVTAWRQLTAADIAASADPNTLLTSITDTGGEIVCTASTLGGGTATPSACYVPRWAIVDPDNPGAGAIDWSAGGYLSLQVWAKFGTNYPDAVRKAFYVGIGNASANAVLMTGLYVQASGSLTKLAASTWSGADKNTVTWTNADNVLFGEEVVTPLAAGTNVLLSYGSAYQIDDATSPGRVASSLAGSLTSTAAGSLEVMAAFSGNIDVACYYRLVKMPVAP